MELSSSGNPRKHPPDVKKLPKFQKSDFNIKEKAVDTFSQIDTFKTTAKKELELKKAHNGVAASGSSAHGASHSFTDPSVYGIPFSAYAAGGVLVPPSAAYSHGLASSGGTHIALTRPHMSAWPHSVSAFPIDSLGQGHAIGPHMHMFPYGAAPSLPGGELVFSSASLHNSHGIHPDGVIGNQPITFQNTTSSRTQNVSHSAIINYPSNPSSSSAFISVKQPSPMLFQQNDDEFEDFASVISSTHQTDTHLSGYMPIQTMPLTHQLSPVGMENSRPRASSQHILDARSPMDIHILAPGKVRAGSDVSRKGSDAMSPDLHNIALSGQGSYCDQKQSVTLQNMQTTIPVQPIGPNSLKGPSSGTFVTISAGGATNSHTAPSSSSLVGKKINIVVKKDFDPKSTVLTKPLGRTAHALPVGEKSQTNAKTAPHVMASTLAKASSQLTTRPPSLPAEEDDFHILNEAVKAPDVLSCSPIVKPCGAFELPDTPTKINKMFPRCQPKRSGSESDDEFGDFVQLPPAYTSGVPVRFNHNDNVLLDVSKVQGSFKVPESNSDKYAHSHKQAASSEVKVSAHAADWSVSVIEELRGVELEEGDLGDFSVFGTKLKPIDPVSSKSTKTDVLESSLILQSDTGATMSSVVARQDDEWQEFAQIIPESSNSIESTNWASFPPSIPSAPFRPADVPSAQQHAHRADFASNLPPLVITDPTTNFNGFAVDDSLDKNQISFSSNDWFDKKLTKLPDSEDAESDWSDFAYKPPEDAVSSDWSFKDNASIQDEGIAKINQSSEKDLELHQSAKDIGASSTEASGVARANQKDWSSFASVINYGTKTKPASSAAQTKSLLDDDEVTFSSAPVVSPFSSYSNTISDSVTKLVHEKPPPPDVEDSDDAWSSFADVASSLVPEHHSSDHNIWQTVEKPDDGLATEQTKSQDLASSSSFDHVHTNLTLDKFAIDQIVRQSPPIIMSQIPDETEEWSVFENPKTVLNTSASDVAHSSDVNKNKYKFSCGESNSQLNLELPFTLEHTSKTQHAAASSSILRVPKLPSASPEEEEWSNRFSPPPIPDDNHTDDTTEFDSGHHNGFEPSVWSGGFSSEVSSFFEIGNSNVAPPRYPVSSENTSHFAEGIRSTEHCEIPVPSKNTEHLAPGTGNEWQDFDDEIVQVQTKHEEILPTDVTITPPQEASRSGSEFGFSPPPFTEGDFSPSKHSSDTFSFSRESTESPVDRARFNVHPPFPGDEDSAEDKGFKLNMGIQPMSINVAVPTTSRTSSNTDVKCEKLSSATDHIVKPDISLQSNASPEVRDQPNRSRNEYAHASELEHDAVLHDGMSSNPQGSFPFSSVQHAATGIDNDDGDDDSSVDTTSNIDWGFTVEPISDNNWGFPKSHNECQDWGLSHSNDKNDTLVHSAENNIMGNLSFIPASEPAANDSTWEMQGAFNSQGISRSPFKFNEITDSDDDWEFKGPADEQSMAEPPVVRAEVAALTPELTVVNAERCALPSSGVQFHAVFEDSPPQEDDDNDDEFQGFESNSGTSISATGGQQAHYIHKGHQMSTTPSASSAVPTPQSALIRVPQDKVAQLLCATFTYLRANTTHPVTGDGLLSSSVHRSSTWARLSDLDKSVSLKLQWTQSVCQTKFLSALQIPDKPLTTSSGILMPQPSAQLPAVFGGYDILQPVPAASQHASEGASNADPGRSTNPSVFGSFSYDSLDFSASVDQSSGDPSVSKGASSAMDDFF